MSVPISEDTLSKNILLITADQFRWDCLGAIGNDVIQTPNLDTTWKVIAPDTFF